MTVSEYRYFLARRAIAPTTLRGNATAEQRILLFGFLSRMPLPKPKSPFSSWLDRQTISLCQQTGLGWGASRKSLNIYCRDLLYDARLSNVMTPFRMDLELPLDGRTMSRMRQENASLPKSSIKTLNKGLSDSYQAFALSQAIGGTGRVDLDVTWWAK